MERKVFFIDNDNKRVKWLSTALSRILIIPMIDAIVLLFVVFTVMFLLDEFGDQKLYIGGPNFIAYVWAVIAYIVVNMIIAVFDFIKFSSFNNTIIVKENNDITIVKGFHTLKGTSKTAMGSVLYNNSNSLLLSLASIGLYASGAIAAQKSLTKNESQTIEEINRILDDRNGNYKYKDYKNCKLINETKKYYKYIGERNGVTSKFKIYKVYSNIDLFNSQEK